MYDTDNADTLRTDIRNVIRCYFFNADTFTMPGDFSEAVKNVLAKECSTSEKKKKKKKKKAKETVETAGEQPSTSEQGEDQPPLPVRRSTRKSPAAAQIPPATKPASKPAAKPAAKPAPKPRGLKPAAPEAEMEVPFPIYTYEGAEKDHQDSK